MTDEQTQWYETILHRLDLLDKKNVVYTDGIEYECRYIRYDIGIIRETLTKIRNNHNRRTL